jgi:hypothetical protein
LSTTQIAVILCETSKPTKWVIDRPPKVRITGRHRPDRGTIGGSSRLEHIAAHDVAQRIRRPVRRPRLPDVHTRLTGNPLCVARQYSGVAGRIENSQVGVFLAYVSRFGQALIDWRLYLPEVWVNDASRRAKAHIPGEIAFAAKIEIARELIAAALDAGARCRFVLADAVYGGDSRLRRMLEARRQSYVLAVRSNHTLRSQPGRPGLQGCPLQCKSTIGDYMHMSGL